MKNLSEQINTSFSIVLESTVELEQETLIHTGMTFFLIRHAFEVGRNSINKKKKYFLLSNHNFVEKLVLAFGFTKGKQVNKSDFVTKFAAVIITVALN